jgi:hypothetical protein
MEATAVAKVLRITRETLYLDRRRAWATLRPVIPGDLHSEYSSRVAPWRGGRRSPSPTDVPDGDST